MKILIHSAAVTLYNLASGRQLIGTGCSTAAQASGRPLLARANGLWAGSYAARQTYYTPQSATLGLHVVAHIK